MMIVIIKVIESSVSSELDRVSSFVVCPARRSALGIEMSLDAKTAAGLASRGYSLQLSVFLVGLGNPADVWVVSDCLMGGINDNNFVVFVGSILGNPVAVENSQSAQSSTNTLLSLGSKIAGRFELVDTD